MLDWQSHLSFKSWTHGTSVQTQWRMKKEVQCHRSAPAVLVMICINCLCTHVLTRSHTFRPIFHAWNQVCMHVFVCECENTTYVLYILTANNIKQWKKTMFAVRPSFLPLSGSSVISSNSFCLASCLSPFLLTHPLSHHYLSPLGI